jgi:hypothetical protein
LKIDLSFKTEEKAKMLERMRANPRVAHVRVAAPDDCLFGLSIQGVYEKDNVPPIPRKECSRPGGCICTYEPVLNTIYP